MNKFPKGLFFCQHLWGVGHVFRSLRICKELVEIAEVDFIQGGDPIKGAGIDSPHFHYHFIPPLNRNSFHDKASRVDHLMNLASRSVERLIALRKIIQGNHYDFVVTESFPFSKLFLQREMLWMFDMVKQVNPEALIFSSYKGITHDTLDRVSPIEIPSLLELELAGYTLLNSYYDEAFIHIDPSIIRLEETTEIPSFILPKIFYTGFISDNAPLIKSSQRQKRILISTGSGFFGDAFILAVAEAAGLLPEYEFMFVIGPHQKPHIKQSLAEKNSPNIKIVEFLSDFDQQLQQCALSVGMAGSSLINLYRTRTPALVFPIVESADQAFLARKFNQLGLVTIISEDDFPPEKMVAALRRALNATYPHPVPVVDINGVHNTVQRITEHLSLRTT